jgi:transcriptional regulator with XRE-family HTH domain
MSLVHKITELRKLRGLTQEEAAKRLNISRATLSRYENGQQSIPAEMIEKILHVYDAPITTLFPTDEEIVQSSASVLRERFEKSDLERIHQLLKEYPELQQSLVEIYHFPQKKRDLSVKQLVHLTQFFKKEKI